MVRIVSLGLLLLLGLIKAVPIPEPIDVACEEEGVCPVSGDALMQTKMRRSALQAQINVGEPHVDRQTSRQDGEGVAPSLVADSNIETRLGSGAAAVAAGAEQTGPAAGGTPRETIEEFCDITGIANMHGLNANATSAELLNERLLNDVSTELSDNNVDQMAKDIFTFYICTRWVPDDVLWKVAEQELSAEILKSVVDKSEAPRQAISELYQNFKFVPLLCSKNLKVFKETSPIDHTYFRKFKEEVSDLSKFLGSATTGHVWPRLKQADELFCGSDQMNSPGCDAKLQAGEMMNRMTSWMGDWGTKFDTNQDGWSVMEQAFRNFSDPKAWTQDGASELASWKQKLPYHSFLSKPAGADSMHSPKSSQRFLVCFGMRVASALHRRPRGDHIITDQNNVGCHGWWDADQASAMLGRIVDLWKPPTCQLADMTYHMKKQILDMFMRMNENLFDALPSMLQDEEMEGSTSGEPQYPEPYSVAQLAVNGKTYFDGMRVAAAQDVEYRYKSCILSCTLKIPKGTGGTLKVNSSLFVTWDVDPEGSQERATEANAITIVHSEYGKGSSGILDSMADAGLNMFGAFKDLFGSLWGGRQTNLAAMMSGSIAKWVVCPVANDTDLADLDSQLGTEDAAFQEHVKQAYSKWTGYKKPVPGAQCEVDDVVPQSEFPGCKVCDITELHTDHPERFTMDNGQNDEFICPVIPPLPTAEQLKVFQEKTGQCLLRMSHEQERQFQWHYTGHYPARKQNNKQENSPKVEYQLVKLLEVDSSGQAPHVSFGRSCTVEEKRAHPRFCGASVLEKPWPSIGEMAEAVSGMLAGSLGMPAGAVTNLISNYQELVAATNENSSAKAVATLVGEKAWDQLMGLGRLAHRTTSAASAALLGGMAGDDDRHARLEGQLFGKGHGGEFMHSMSYQKAIGKSDTTSTSRERYRRYAVTCPCHDFDPAMELALRWRWSQTALRAAKEALKYNPSLLDKPEPSVGVRGEARLFHKMNSQDGNDTWYTYGAAIDSGLPEPAVTSPVQCQWTGWFGNNCEPTSGCEIVGSWPSRECVGKAPPSLWRVVGDAALAGEVGGNPTTQQAPDTVRSLKVTYHCGTKASFSNSVGTGPRTSVSLKSCMQAGVRANAAMKAAQPWKLYFPEEVIVVAVFGAADTAGCYVRSAGAKEKLCNGGLISDSTLDKHLGPAQKTSSDADYHGMRAGAGFVDGIIKEVVMRPEDLLQVNNLLF